MNRGLSKGAKRNLDTKDRISNRVISDASVVLRETTLTFSDSIETGLPVKTEIVRVVSLSTTEITEITRLKKNTIFRVRIPKCTCEKYRHTSACAFRAG